MGDLSERLIGLADQLDHRRYPVNVELIREAVVALELASTEKTRTKRLEGALKLVLGCIDGGDTESARSVIKHALGLVESWRETTTDVQHGVSE